MKKIILSLMLLIITPCAISKIMDSRNYQMDADNIFMITLSSIYKLNFEIIEIQSSSGYILFKTPSGDEYLVMVSENSSTSSNIKISKLKNSSPLTEIQEILYSSIENSLNDIPKKAEE